MLKVFCLALFLFFFCGSHALGQLQECDGTWTNQGCETQETHKIAEAPKKSSTAISKKRELFRKRVLVQQLADTRKSIEKRFKIKVNTLAIEQFCMDSDTPLSECKDEVTFIEERLLKRAEIEKELEEKEEKEKEPTQDPNNTNIIVIQDDRFPIWNVRPRRRHWRHDFKYRSPQHRPSNPPVNSNAPNPTRTPKATPKRNTGFTGSLIAK